jgi:hypothetical protein
MKTTTRKVSAVFGLIAIAALATAAQAQVAAYLVQWYPQGAYQMCVYQYPNGRTFVRSVGFVGQSACPAAWY